MEEKKEGRKRRKVQRAIKSLNKRGKTKKKSKISESNSEK